jgi:hypothetical protein
MVSKGDLGRIGDPCWALMGSFLRWRAAPWRSAGALCWPSWPWAGSLGDWACRLRGQGLKARFRGPGLDLEVLGWIWRFWALLGWIWRSRAGIGDPGLDLEVQGWIWSCRAGIWSSKAGFEVPGLDLDLQVLGGGLV